MQHLKHRFACPPLILWFGMMCLAPVVAQAALVTITIKGTLASGLDLTGVFGFPPNTDLTGQSFTLTFSFDDTKGKEFVNSCGPFPFGISCASGISNPDATVSSPGTAVLQIGNGTWSFGLPPNVSLSSAALLQIAIPPGTTGEVAYYVSDLTPDGGGWDFVSIGVVPAPGSPPLTTSSNWESAFSDTRISAAGLAPLITNAFIILDFQRGAGGNFSPTSITVSGVPTVTILDPVPQLLSGPHITTAASDLGDLTKGRAVKGVATDGVAQVVLRISADSVGETFSVGVRADQCGGLSATDCVDEYGFVFDPMDPPVNVFSNTFGQPVTVTAVSTANGPMAFVAYRAPLDFVRSEATNNASDQMAAQRSVFISLNNGTVPDQQIMLVRPPVIYIHGLTSDPCSWVNFNPLISSTLFTHYLLSYTDDIDNRVTAESPTFPITHAFSSIRAHVVGVDWNANNLILPRLKRVLSSFKQALPSPYVNACASVAQATSPMSVAAVQGDIVAHSMGGLIARDLRYIADFSNTSTYGQGMIHKLVTIGTPHLGSHVAERLLDGTNNCVRGFEPIGTALFSDATSYIFTTLTIDNQSVNGAVVDLAGDGTVANSSNLIKALQRIPPGNLPQLRMAMIAGDASQSQFNQINFSSGQIVTIALCGTHTLHLIVVPGDFLADNFVGSKWRNVFSDDSDAFVSLQSALNGIPIGQAGAVSIPNVVHGRGTVNELKFGPPHLQDSLSTAPSLVQTLLNTSVSRNDVFISVP